MRTLVKIAAIILLIIMCQNPAVSVGKITEDPNAGPQAPAQTAEEKDSRLEVKINYEARHKAIKHILDDLTEISGMRTLTPIW